MLTNSLSIPTLMAQLQARYPNASLIAEFVTVHQEHLVVRALVQVGGVPLATGMAAATDIEQAEDRAKIRALAALGIGGFTPSAPHQSPAYSIPTTSSVPTANLSSSPSFSAVTLVSSDSSIASMSSEAGSNPSHLPGSMEASGVSTTASGSSDISLPNSSISPSVHHLQPLASDDRPQSEVSLSSVSASASPLDVAKATNVAARVQPEVSDPESSTPEFDRAEYEFSYEPETDQTAPYKPEDYSHAEIDLISEPDSSPLESIESSPPAPKAAGSTKPATSSKGKTTKRKAEPESVEMAPSTAGESDRSEEIAKIGLEMKRLGWTTEQGRNYLKRTYGKRSRQELDDTELIDFLRYLEAQVSSSESPF